MQDGLGRSGPRDRLYSISKDSINGTMSPVLHDVPSLREELDEVRTSFRSALTSNSSTMGSTVGTSRSSVATADSSISDFVKLDRVESRDVNRDTIHDYNFDVDDALEMYAVGFETPVRQSVDKLRRDSFPPRASLDSLGSHLRPSASPLANNNSRSSSARSHRRSQSAGFLERLRVHEDISIPLPSPGLMSKPTSSPRPSLNHVRTSTQIIAGRELPSAPNSVRGSFVAPKPVPRDRYGFKKTSHYIKLEEYEAWEKTYSEHIDRRRGKWVALMKQSGLNTENPVRFPAKSDKVKRYVRKGIPPEWRGQAWFWYAGGPGKLARDPGRYRTLLRQVDQGKLSDNDREHIERDLNRTFPDNIRFKPDPTYARDSHTDSTRAATNDDGQENETDMVCALRRLLQAFAVHNPNIGYCQSLNFIAGLLLLFLDQDEEKAFVLLNVVTSEHLPGTHGVALEGANVDIAVLMMAIRENIPSVWVKLDDRQPTNSMHSGGAPRLPTVSLATTAWFMSLFVGTLPIESVLRVWDCLFFEGSKTLFRVALAIFKAGEQQIRAVNDPMEIFQVVQSMPRSMIDANALMECCFRKRNGFGTMSQDSVEKRREERRKDAREGNKGIGEPDRPGGRGYRLVRVKSRGRFGVKKG